MNQNHGRQGIHLMAKPAGPSCNLRCDYCFYLEKEALFQHEKHCRMSDEVLEAYIRRCTDANRDDPEGILFAWQGGEPTLMGLDFFHKAIALEHRYAVGRPVRNTLQTNGTLLDDRWCSFLAANNFLVGLSLDGPPEIHNRYRHTSSSGSTFKKVYRALSLLKKHGVEFNIMASVARETAEHPLEVYRFFKSEGLSFIQFIPIVERMPDERARNLGLSLGTPPAPDLAQESAVTPWTVEPEALGDFFCNIFNEWVRHDVGKVFVMNFEWTLFAWLGGDGPVCYLSRECGNSCIVEHNGDVYSCDHFVYPEYLLGNVCTTDARTLVQSEKQRQWGIRKETMLPSLCRECDILNICRGGCPKHRFTLTASGEPGLNYLCPAYKKFYRYSRKYMSAFGKLMEYDLPLEYIMQAIDAPLVIKRDPSDTESPTIILSIR
ncbi:MAG: anaerobic sulfatase maturase [Vulcanimicrobiota bacterium]